MKYLAHYLLLFTIPVLLLAACNNDGSPISNLLLAPELETMPGDTVSIEMRTIDRATYKYLVALDASNGNGPNASVPANRKDRTACGKTQRIDSWITCRNFII